MSINQSGWRPEMTEERREHGGTATGNKALMLEEALIFEIGDTHTTGVDIADVEAKMSKLGGLERTADIGLPEALGIPKVSQNREAAIAFVKWFTSKQFQIENYANGVLPTRTSALADLNAAGKLQSGDALVAQSKTVEPLFAQGTPTWYPQFSSAVNTAINGVAKGQLTVDQAMKNIADATQKAMTQ